MKIIQICTADSLGGLELYFASCCRNLQKRGHAVLAIVTPSSKLAELLQKENIDFIELLSVSVGTIQQFRTLNRTLRAFEPDIVHVHHKKDLLIGALLRRFGAGSFKYVHTRQMDLPRKKKNLYHTFIYSSIDLLIAITKRLKEQIVERINIDPKKVRTLYYGVPVSKSEPKRCLEIIDKSSHFKIGVIARIDNKKEQHVILEAIGILKGRGLNDLKAYLIGGSTDNEYLARLQQIVVDEKLEKEVVMKGFVDNPQSLMPCFDVVVLTTGNETFGLVLPEAMRMGVAVIGADGGGVPEIIDDGENGLLFKVGSPSSLAEQIELLFDDETKNRLAASGKKKADKHFELEHHFDQLEKLFSNTR